MGRYFFILIVLSLSLLNTNQAQTIINSDTSYLQTGEQEFDFNITNASFHKVNLLLFIRLNENCQFDNGEFLSLKINNNNPQSEIKKIEFARIYLPSFSNKRPQGNEIIYDFDLTLWQSLLYDHSKISIEYTGASLDLEIAMSFNLEEGAMPVEVLDIIPLWQSNTDGFPYGKKGIDAKYLPTRNVKLPEKTSSAFISVIVNGAGKNTKDEQSPRFYFLDINGNEIAKRSIWREDCGLNPIYPQGDQWYDNHHNWCPGLRVNPLVHYLSAEVIKNKQLNIDLHFQNDLERKSAVDSYITSSVLFALAEPKEQVNVSISEIIAPNIDLWHHRYNPICGSPILLIQNNGKETVNTITINYGYNYETDNKFRWKGELGFMEQEIVYLPPLNWYFYDNDDEPETFTAHISKVNKTEKAFIGGKKTSVMELASVLPHKLIFEIQTGDHAAHIGLEIYKEDGDAIFVSEELENNKNYQFNLSLVPGCYEMIFYDDEGNGIQLSDADAACLIIKDQKKGLVLKEYKGDFGLEIREQFMVFH